MMADHAWESALLEYYVENYPEWFEALDFLEAYVRVCLRGLDVSVHSISGRVKTFQSIVEKVSRKEYAESGAAEIDSIVSKVDDIIGIRIVLYFEDEIGHVVDRMRSYFSVRWEENKSEELEKRENTFGYRGYHIGIDAQGEISKHGGKPPLTRGPCEIQVRTITQDAWTVLHHKLFYKRRSVPERALRRAIGLAGQFEEIDNIYIQLRDSVRDFEVSGDPGDAASGKSDDVNLHAAIIERFGEGSLSDLQFQQMVREFYRYGLEPGVAEFIEAHTKFGGTLSKELSLDTKFAPGTADQVKILYYLSNPLRYKHLIRPRQRQRLEAYVAEGKAGL